MSPSRTATAPPWVTLLSEMLRGSPRLPNAACREHPELFDAVDDPAAVEAASALCETCCRDFDRRRAWADALPPNAIHGVIAGEHRDWPEPASRGRPQRQGELFTVGSGHHDHP